jgi:hypothetical protein
VVDHEAGRVAEGCFARVAGVTRVALARGPREGVRNAMGVEAILLPYTFDLHRGPFGHDAGELSGAVWRESHLAPVFQKEAV